MTELEKLGAGAVKAASFLNGKNSEYKKDRTRKWQNFFVKRTEEHITVVK